MIHNSFLVRGVVHGSYTLLWTRFNSGSTMMRQRCVVVVDFSPVVFVIRDFNLYHSWRGDTSPSGYPLPTSKRNRCRFWTKISSLPVLSLVFTTYFHSKKKIHHAIFTHLVSRIPIDVCGGGRQFYPTNTTTITTTTIDGIHNNHNNNTWTNRHPTAHVRWNLTRITRG